MAFAPPVGVAVNVEGVPELRRLFRDAAKSGVPLSMKRTNKAIGELVIQRARPRLPVVAGDYAASLRASNTSWVAQVRAGGKRKAPHAPLIHWGTRYRPSMPARPQIVEAAVELIPRIEDMYLNGVEKELQKIGA